MCEFCGNEKDIIFPFQLHKCQRCEGEHALPGTGLVGSRSPFPRPSASLPWRDWKISKPRRLSNVLSRDMRDGEGGEHFQGSTDGAKGVAGAGRTESEQEGKKGRQKGGEEGGGGPRRKAYRKLGPMLGERRVRREANLLRTLHIGRLKKTFSKGDSGSESMESQEEAAQEKKRFWNVPKLTVFSKSSPARDKEDGGKRGAKEDEEGWEVHEGAEAQEEEEKGRRLAEDNEASDKTAETERSSAEKLGVLKLLRAQKRTAVLSRGRRVEEEEESRCRESDGETDAAAVEGGATIITRKTWRGRNTRRARRISRGRKMRDLTGRGSQSDSGESTERDAGGSESGGSEEYGQGQTGSQREEGQRLKVERGGFSMS